MFLLPLTSSFLGTLEGVNAKVISVQTDEHGICPESLDATFAEIEQAGQLDRVKMVYLVSEYDNPRGISIAEERREPIIDVVKKWSTARKIYILEDSAYRELHYDGAAPASLWSREPSREMVILAQTFSKSFSPGLRTGFGILPKELVTAVCNCKGNEDFGSVHFSQQVLAEIFAAGKYQEHVLGLQNSYRIKRDAMLEAAERYFKHLPGVSWVRPGGGLYVWMSLPKSIETGFQSPLFHEAVHTHQVMYVPGELFYAKDDPHRKTNEMRLSFGVQDAAGIDEGMKRLAAAVEGLM